MLKALRTAVRMVLPRKQHALLDAPFARSAVDEAWGEIYQRVSRAAGYENDEFVLNRFHEGLRWRRVLEHFLPGETRARVLDVGAGNGAVELAIAANPRFLLSSVDQSWNHEAKLVHDTGGTPFGRVLSNASALPFASGSFDAVVCLETLEHFIDARAACREMSRVLRRNAIVLIITPPRWRYVLRPDPHFHIRGLVSLPPSLQRQIAARRGHDGPQDYVGRIYTSVGQIARLFPGCEVDAVLSRSRAPKRWSWDAIILRRSESGSG